MNVSRLHTMLAQKILRLRCMDLSALALLDSISLLATLEIFHTSLARLHILEAALGNDLVACFQSVPLYVTFYCQVYLSHKWHILGISRQDTHDMN